MTLKEIREKALRPLYEEQLAHVVQLNKEIAALIEGGDFDLASGKALDLNTKLKGLNTTANKLADIQ